MHSNRPPTNPPGSPLDVPVVWRAPSGLRGFVSRIGIGHALEGEVDGHKWQLTDAEDKRAIFKLVIDGQDQMNIEKWPRAWVDTVGLRHLQRERHDRTIDMRRPIDIAASSGGTTADSDRVSAPWGRRSAARAARPTSGASTRPMIHS